MHLYSWLRQNSGFSGEPGRIWFLDGKRSVWLPTALQLRVYDRGKLARYWGVWVVCTSWTVYACCQWTGERIYTIFVGHLRHLNSCHLSCQFSLVFLSRKLSKVIPRGRFNTKITEGRAICASVRVADMLSTKCATDIMATGILYILVYPEDARIRPVLREFPMLHSTPRRLFQ